MRPTPAPGPVGTGASAAPAGDRDADDDPSGTRPGGLGGDAGGRPRRDLAGIALTAAIAYIPLLLTARGQVAADTKTYLTIDPAGVLADAPHVWDSQIGLGTVTHQYIGYLWPMGPFFWLLDALGLPDWAAQRLWLGSVLLAAGLGVRFLLRTLDWNELATRSPVGRPAVRWGLLVAGLAYMLSPYLLEYAARISVILLPWAALPWLLGLTVRAVRTGGWVAPAVFAVVVQTVGGINATALLLIGLGPLLWLGHAVVVDRSATARQALAAAGRIGVLTLATSLWWIAGLWAEGRYGLPVIRYTETYRTVAEVSTAPEVLRGLGYWFFYGNDKLGPWIEANVTFTEDLGVLALSFTLPVLALVAAALVRWRHRLFFAVLALVGVLVAVGSHPWDGPSPLGSVFKALTRTDAGLSMRSTPRATPLVVLALAVFLGSGVAALGRRLPRLATPTGLVVALLVAANLPTLWLGQVVAANLQRPEDLPAHWREAAAALDAGGRGTRVLELPGADFASYRWGNTVDPVTPGLTDRGYVARELFPWGAPASTNLLNAFDRRFHEDDIDTAAIAPLARLLGVGDIVLRADLQYERYRTARPRPMWALLNATPGLGPPVGFGEPVPNVAGPELPLVDEIELGGAWALPDPPPVAVFPVEDPVGVVRTHPAAQPLVLAGDGDGVVDTASMGLLDPDQALFYAASLTADPPNFEQAYGAGADLVVTDTNRKRARRWGTLRETSGYTEQPGESPLVHDPGDQRLELFDRAADEDLTVVEQRGGATVRATDYGNPITYTANDRAAMALDGDPLTAWRVGAVDDPIGQRLVIDLDEPVTTGELRLLQPINLFRNRSVTTARLHFGDGTSVDVALDGSSRQEPGQVVTFPVRTFDHLEVEVADTDVSRRPRYDGISGVGFAEVGIAQADGGEVRVEELVRPPTAALTAAGASSIDHRLGYVLTRLRSNPAEPVRTDEELALRRLITLPAARALAVTAQARLAATASDEVLDRLLGIPGAAQGGVSTRADDRLPGSTAQRAHAAFDGDRSTHWSSPFLDPRGRWVEATGAEPVTVERLDLAVVADGRHSVPTRVTLTADGDPTTAVTVELPPVPDGASPDATVAVPVTLPRPVTGRAIRLTVDDVRPVRTTDWYSAQPVEMPVAIAEVGVPGLVAPAPPPTFDTGCRLDLVAVDGAAVPVRVTGTTAAAVAGEDLDVTACAVEARTPTTDGPASGLPVVDLAAGDHVVRTGTGRDLGIDVDRLLLASDRRGEPLGAAGWAAAGLAPGPPVMAVDQGRESYGIDVDSPDGAPFWLAVGQSWNDGWEATVEGRDLGPPQLIDGYGNGWLITPAGPGPVRATVTWAPQRVVWVAIGASVVAVAACLALVVVGLRRRARAGAAVAAGSGQADRTELATPGGRPRERVGLGAAMLVAAITAAAAVANLPADGWYPAVALGLGVATFVAYRAPRGRGWLALAGAGCLAVAGAYVVWSQARHGYESDFTWPQQFTRVHVLGLLAPALVALDALRQRLVPSGRPGQVRDGADRADGRGSPPEGG